MLDEQNQQLSCLDDDANEMQRTATNEQNGRRMLTAPIEVPRKESASVDPLHAEHPEATIIAE